MVSGEWDTTTNTPVQTEGFHVRNRQTERRQRDPAPCLIHESFVNNLDTY